MCMAQSRGSLLLLRRMPGSKVRYSGLLLCSLQFWMCVVLWKAAVLTRMFRDLSQCHQTSGGVVFSDR